MINSKYEVKIRDWPIAHWLFNDIRSAPFWLVLRVWLGWQWLSSGLGKAQLTDFANGKWLANGGAALKGFWDKALTTPPDAKNAAITYEWYYNFLKGLSDGGHYEWFAWIIVLGEIAVGLGLIFGCLTGIAALGGALMNFSFLLAGSSSTNPILLIAAVLIILAWRTAGWWGLDRYILPILGTPWQEGKLFQRHKTPDDPNPIVV